MSKAEGKKISIDFTLPLVGDVTGNEGAFTISSQEYLYTDGPDGNGQLINKTYGVESVERYGVSQLWNLGQSLQLPIGEIPIGTTYENATQQGEGIAHSTFSSAYPISAAFDGILTNNGWSAVGTIGRWIGIDFGENPKMISKFRAFSYQQRFKGFVFEASNDNSTWEVLQIGQLNNLREWDEFEFENNTEYRYYRLRCTSVYTGSNVSLTELEMHEGFNVYGYQTIGITEVGPLQYTGDYRVRWMEEVPINTTLVVEYTTGSTQGDWHEVSSGDIITANTNLWFRVKLETNNIEITPTLQDLWIEEPFGPQDIIRLVMADGFKNAQGSIEVSYNQTLGHLLGDGGAVASFVVSFTPTELMEGLTDVGGQYGTHEHIQADVDAVVSLKYIEKIYSYNTEYIEADVSALVDFIHVDEINP